MAGVRGDEGEGLQVEGGGEVGAGEGEVVVC